MSFRSLKWPQGRTVAALDDEAMAEMAVVLEDHSPATLHDEEGLVAGSGPHHGAGVVPPSCVRIEDADLVESVEPTCFFFFLAGADGRR
jgi:hypothetical protein